MCLVFAYIICVLLQFMSLRLRQKSGFSQSTGSRERESLFSTRAETEHKWHPVDRRVLHLLYRLLLYSTEKQIKIFFELLHY